MGKVGLAFQAGEKQIELEDRIKELQAENKKLKLVIV